METDTGTQELSELALLTLEKKGPPPKSRIGTVRAATEIYENLRKADEASSINRARVQAMFDGTPPYSEAALRASGQSFRCNLNFGEGEKFLENALSAYVDLVNSVESMVRIQTAFGDEAERVEWSRIMSEEYSFQLRKWPRFDYEYLNLCNHFVGHGVGINFFEDELNWQWRSTGLGDFLVPRQTQADERAIEVAAAERAMKVTDLYRHIENPEIAGEMGWDVGEVRKAIMTATEVLPDINDWEKFQAEIKNNDLWNGAKAAKVELVHMWVQEFNGTITHLITLKNANNKKFLYKRIGRYGGVNQAFNFFTYGIGTNGTYHSIRGLGYKIYHHVQVNNRIRSQAVDNSMIAGAPMIQPEDERALDNFSFNYYGPFALLPPGIKYVDRTFPNATNTMFPMLEDLTQMLNERTGQYSTAGLFGGKNQDRKTRFEVAAHLEEASKLNVTALNLFYQPWDRHHMEVARRFFRVNYSADEPGGAEVHDFRRRCIERGVPEEALAMVDVRKTRAVRSVGSGSQAKRMVSLQQLNEIAGTFDEEGRHNLFRDQTAAIVGHEAADRYIPSKPDQRIPVDAKIAELENRDMATGGEIPVYPNELHVVHLDVHLPAIEQMFQAVEEGQLALEEATPQVIQIFYHAVQHLEHIQQDPTIGEKVTEFNGRLQQASEMIINGEKRIAALEREAAQAAQEEGAEGAPQEGQPEGNPEQQEKLIEHRLKLQMMQEKHQVEMMIRLQKAEQDRQINDAKAASDVRSFLQ
jgi:hypothetical protein